jgi:predicted dehydrogenase
MIKIGIADFDGHAGVFTHLLQNPDLAESERVPGARVIAGYADPRAASFGAENRQAAITNCQKMGVKMVDSVEDLLHSGIDAVMVLSVNGRFHLEKAAPFLKAGIPTYIDKSFAGSTTDARELVRLADETKTPLYSASSVRYAKNVKEILAQPEKYGSILGVAACGPTIPLDGMHGLFFYGIHTIELLFTFMGSGVEWVSSTTQGDENIITAGWRDGRMATALLAGSHHGQGENGHSFIAWCEKDTVVRTAQPDGLELVKNIIQFYTSGVSPVDPHQSLEGIALMDAAIASEARQGERVAVTT